VAHRSCQEFLSLNGFLAVGPNQGQNPNYIYSLNRLLCINDGFIPK